MFLVYIGCTLGHIVHVQEAQPGPEPSPPKGINLISSHNGFNNPKVLHLPHGSHGYKGVGGGHPTRKREAEPYPEPISTHGTAYWGSRGGSAKPLHTLLASHGFHGFGGGHGVRKREADPNSAKGSRYWVSGGGGHGPRRHAAPRGSRGLNGGNGGKKSSQ